jgi:hypothetical protein
VGDPEGDKRTSFEIDADDVAPSLKWAIATPERAEPSRNGERGTERGQFNDPRPFCATFDAANALAAAGALACGTSGAVARASHSSASIAERDTAKCSGARHCAAHRIT